MAEPTNLRQSSDRLLTCFGCKRVLEVGDLYIKDTLGGYCESGETPGGSEVDALLGAVFSGTGDGSIIFCEDCTELTPDGRYLFETVYYGDETLDRGRSDA